jgi:ApaG protein
MKQSSRPSFSGVRELHGWNVEVLEVRFMPELDAPSEKPYPFLYAIRICNESDEVVTLRGRKWVVREDSGDTVVVEGEGVVGEMPRLEKGGEFSYNSYHVVADSATVQGAYFGETDSGEKVFTRIPGFHLEHFK